MINDLYDSKSRQGKLMQSTPICLIISDLSEELAPLGKILVISS